jgi:hypothetical protein
MAIINGYGSYKHNHIDDDQMLDRIGDSHHNLHKFFVELVNTQGDKRGSVGW